MYANVEETALFKNGPFMVDFFLAELPMETEQWDEAKEAYTHMLELPKLSKNQLAYVTYAIAVVQTFQGNYEGSSLLSGQKSRNDNCLPTS